MWASSGTLASHPTWLRGSPQLDLALYNLEALSYMMSSNPPNHPNSQKKANNRVPQRVWWHIQNHTGNQQCWFTSSRQEELRIWVSKSKSQWGHRPGGWSFGLSCKWCSTKVWEESPAFEMLWLWAEKNEGGTQRGNHGGLHRWKAQTQEFRWLKESQTLNIRSIT